MDDANIRDEQPKDDEQIDEKEDVATPEVGMVFDSLAEVKYFYKNYAYDHGFSIIVRNMKRKSTRDDTVKYLTFMCEKEAKPRRTTKIISFRKFTLFSQRSKRTNCKGKLKVKELEDGRVKILKSVFNHNHGLISTRRSMHITEKIDSRVKRRLNLEDRAVNKKLVLCDHNKQLSSSSIKSPRMYFDSLPEELFVDILQKLPRNLIHRAKCVSKHWLELISRDGLLNIKPPFGFFYRHKTYHPSIEDSRYNHVFSENLVFQSSGFSLDFLPASSVHVLCSSNGLVFCSTYPLASSHHNQYYVCNPLTKQWVTLPPPSSNDNSCPYIFGFVCKSTNTGCSFRIVRTRDLRSHNGALKHDTYSSESGKWKESCFGLPNAYRFFNLFRNPKGNIACNGLFHWVNSKGNILVFDPYKGNSKCKIISGPTSALTEIINPIIGVCNGRLMYFEQVSKKFSDEFSVWKIEDYERSKWSLVHKFSLDQMNIQDYYSSHSLPLGFHPFDEDYVYFQKSCDIVQCDMRSKTLKTVCKTDSYGKMSIVPITLPWWPVPLSLN